MSEFFAPLLTTGGLLSLFTLVMLEIVLGIDNIIFIAIICGYIPDKKEQQKARVIGLTMALAMRIVLLMTISWIVRLIMPLFYIGDFGVSGRDLILFAGGVFLIVKTLKEIVHKFTMAGEFNIQENKVITMKQAIFQIMLIDIVFSFDSIITAVGLSNDIVIMVLAVTAAMLVMILCAPYVSDFINKHPTIKMLALAFLIAIGVMLTLESLHVHVDKSYVYVAMGFSVIVELLNIRLRNALRKNNVPE